MKRACYAATTMFSTPEKQDAPRLQAGAFLTSDATSSEIPLIFDTGASFSVSPCIDDFIHEPESLDGQVGLSDFNDNQTIASGIGWVEWTIRDSFGKSSIIRTQAYYVPGASVRLLCPFQYRKENKERYPQAGTYHSDGDSNLTLLDTFGNELHFVLSEAQRLPVMNLTDDVAETGFTNHMACTLRTIQDDPEMQHLLYEMNHNLSKPQKELRLWHSRLAHAGFAWIQDLMRSQKTNVGDYAEPPAIPTTHQTTSSCQSPKCAACFFAKQHRRTPRSQTIVNKPEKEMAIRRGAMKPGECVSGDQYMSSQPGRLPNTYGKEQMSNKYNGGTMLVDHYSAYIHLNHQISLRVGETLRGKHDFERFASLHGVKIRRYRADNQPFDSAEFRDDIELQDQELDFSGTGAHFQNGVAERAIQTVTTWARAMMMHQLNNWPDAFDESLWPFAMDQAIHIWNNLPRHRSGLTPFELFTGTKQPHYGAIQQARVWGCPAYVLDPTLQDGKKLPKWQKRARCGMYLGASPNHADSVGRILSLTTGHVSPQYHVVYDELFHTTIGALTDAVFDQVLWNSLLVLDGHENLLEPEDRNNQDVLRPAIDMYDLFRDDSDDDSDDDLSELDAVPEGVEENDVLPDVLSDDETVPTSNETSSNSQRTRSGQTVKPMKSYVPSMSSERRYAATCQRQQHQKDHHKPWQQAIYYAGGNPNKKVKSQDLQNQALQSLDWNPDHFLDRKSVKQTRQILLTLLQNVDSGEWNPMALAAKQYDEFNPSYEMAMNGSEREGYIQATHKELDTLERMDVWDEVDRKPWMTVIGSTLVFRKKVFPSGEVRKLKARLCARGDQQQEGVDFFETFAPVVNWTTVCLLLMLSVQLELATLQVDYTAAFVHAPIDRPPNWDEMTPEEQDRAGVYVGMPRGFGKPGKVYKLKKSLYGLKQAPRNFFQHLKKNLEQVGFEQQIDIDPCLFISSKVICLVYVDDTLLFARHQEDIDEVIHKLTKEQDMELEIESAVAGFLGVDIKSDKETGQVTLTQTGLIDRIIAALDCDDLPPVDTPADEVLGKDEFGEPRNCTFNYASVIGQLWYLYGHSRPDLGFAVSQAARFSFNPKRSHELALIRIGQYLKGTRDKGMILKPIDTNEFVMDAYVDSDFMGLYGKENPTDPTSAKSRTGFVICINDCPIVWSSKLQDGVSLSTMMAEYYALSTAMRDVLPLRDLTKGIAKGLGISEECVTKFKTTVWEDNNGALSLANLEPGHHTPRSRFYAARTHWFRQHITREGEVGSNVKDGIYVKKIETANQLADLFTKPLSKEIFEALRKKLIGW